MKDRIVLVILDGWGYREQEEWNAVYEANTKNIDKYTSKYPSTLLSASGASVGLPEGTAGFCELSYYLFGVGKKMVWDNQKIMKEIDKGSFRKKIEPILKSSRRVHVFAPLTENGIYSHVAMLKDILGLAKSKRKRLFVHLILEGRESGLHSAYDLFQRWKDDALVNNLASIVGSRYVLNRNVSSLIDEYLSSLANPQEIFPSFVSALMTGYDDGENDFTMKPRVLTPDLDLLEGDTALVLGYRSNKWDLLLESLINAGLNVYMISYPNKSNVNVVYKTRPTSSGFIKYIASSKGKIMKIGETEKAMDLTYFFTGGNDIGDTSIFPSPATLDYSITPEMASSEITGEALKTVKLKEYDLIVVSFAAPDVVAHTGNYDALLKALEVVDDGVGRIVRAAQKEGYVPIITGDHGNAEEMYREGKLYLGHTTNPVPFILASDKYRGVKLKEGSLIDVAPTMAKIMGKRVKLDGKPLF